MIEAHEKGGAKSARDVNELVSEVTALFAGGTLDENAKEGVMAAINRAYWDAKEKNKNTLRRSIANKSPLYCNYLKYYEYDAEQIARAMNSDINLIALKISHLIEMGYNLRGIECNSRFLR